MVRQTGQRAAGSLRHQLPRDIHHLQRRQIQRGDLEEDLFLLIRDFQVHDSVRHNDLAT